MEAWATCMRLAHLLSAIGSPGCKSPVTIRCRSSAATVSLTSGALDLLLELAERAKINGTVLDPTERANHQANLKERNSSLFGIPTRIGPPTCSTHPPPSTSLP